MPVLGIPWMSVAFVGVIVPMLSFIALNYQETLPADDVNGEPAKMDKENDSSGSWIRYNFIDMKNIQPQQPSHLSPYAQACLIALVNANLADRISLGGGLGLFHYLDYRPTHDVDAWWSDSLTEAQKQAVLEVLETSLSSFGSVRIRAWGDVLSVELSQAGKTVFSFQIAARTLRLEEPVSAGWINVPLDSLADLVASKMNALVERGAPRDFLDIFTLCQSGLLSVDECWALWFRRQSLSGSDTDAARACLAIETHLERIALHRPLEKIIDLEQRHRAQQLRDWFLDEFLQAKKNE